jgi:predicted nucleic acid-binding protein
VSALPLLDFQDAPGESTPPPARRIFVPDASVGMKWYVSKPDSAAALRMLDSRFELHIPTCFFVEAAGVLQRKVAIDRTL